MVGSGHNGRPLKMFYSSIGGLITRSVAGGKDVHLFFFSVGTKSSTGSSKNAGCQLIIIIIINTLFILQKIGQLSMKKQLVQ